MRVNVFLIATAKMVLSALEIIVTPLSWILLLNFQVNNFYRLGRAVVRSENPDVLWPMFMVIRAVEFSNSVYQIRKSFA